MNVPKLNDHTLTILAVIVVGLLAFLASAFLIWLGWNLCLPPLVHLGVMSYPEALGATLLLSVLGALRVGTTKVKD